MPRYIRDTTSFIKRITHRETPKSVIYRGTRKTVARNLKTNQKTKRNIQSRFGTPSRYYESCALFCYVFFERFSLSFFFFALAELALFKERKRATSQLSMSCITHGTVSSRKRLAYFSRKKKSLTDTLYIHRAYRGCNETSCRSKTCHSNDAGAVGRRRGASQSAGARRIKRATFINKHTRRHGVTGRAINSSSHINGALHRTRINKALSLLLKVLRRRCTGHPRFHFVNRSPSLKRSFVDMSDKRASFKIASKITDWALVSTVDSTVCQFFERHFKEQK